MSRVTFSCKHPQIIFTYICSRAKPVRERCFSLNPPKGHEIFVIVCLKKNFWNFPAFFPFQIPNAVQMFTAALGSKPECVTGRSPNRSRLTFSRQTFQDFLDLFRNQGLTVCFSAYRSYRGLNHSRTGVTMKPDS